ncbi:DEAD/DEAH box helicase [Gulosibacter chungangensis]|uniref:DEAD/DEAH box helicase n=2 Tax=Gulosibacter chungangensis TaxID=979746 RepID=A0A7J5BAE3_9MICO|nr:DEAD/DEAH box helicase [Gulosibacter chungangensis]
MQGNYFEELVRHFLMQDATWGTQHDEVWLWNDWPDKNGTDTGIDLVARRKDGGLTAIQCKFFREDRKVQKGDLDSFLEALGREPFTDGIWVDTTAVPWSGNATEALKNRNKKVRTVGLEQFRHSNIDWSTYEVLDPRTAPQTFDRKQLRPHQFKAVQSVMSAFDDDVTRGKMIMACGTGKTFTALKLAEEVTRKHGRGYSTILFLVPSLALLQQTLEEWSVEHDPELPMTAFVVGSDQTVGRTKTGDITSVAIEELAVPATTDGKSLARDFDHRADTAEGMTVVFSTYQSLQAVHEAQQISLPTFDLVICDEAHRTTGVTLSEEDESSFVKIHDEDYIDAERRIYMTATPRIYNDTVKNTAREKEAVLVSMDNEELFGKTLYRLSFGEAVEQNLLTDYKVLVLGVTEDQVTDSFQSQLADSTYELPLKDVTKLVGCWNGLAKRQSGDFSDGFGTDRAPMRRAVAFLKDIKTSKRAASEFPALVDDHLSNITNDDPTDDLAVQVRHVDGTMRSVERQEALDWLKEDIGEDSLGRPVTRILTNARCLSEGVDVPSLDAVLFLNPRKSQVDVVQAVGRVMRRSKGKQFGYIILPIAIPVGVSAEAALGQNEPYEVVWQVLQALRAHDERLDAQINQMAISGKAPETVVVSTIDLNRKSTGEGDSMGQPAAEPERERDSGSHSQDSARMLTGLSAEFDEAWKDGVYAKLVKNVGDRMYWDDWARDINEIASRFIRLISAHLEAPATDRRPFDRFVQALTKTVNPEVTDSEAIEMLAQHMITRPIFDAMFPEHEFSEENPISSAMGKVVAAFSENAAFEKEMEPLEGFYAKVTDRIRGLDDVTSKQKMLVMLYDRFFSQAFPRLRDKMGIVFTPIEVVDYIIHSADVLTQSAFGKSLSDEGVKILDPFIGTGTFMTRLLQSGIIRPEDLQRKYRHELFANEIVLLSYYIAAVNVEAVYREVCEEQGLDAGDSSFPGISLVDTFAMYDRERRLAGDVFPANTKRIEKQRDSKISVIMMNPPYSVGQSSANDNNQNESYPLVDDRIRNTYAARSTAQNKNGLYDSYYRALRWATDRLNGRGIIAFVSNSGFVDGNTADGVRLSWQQEFDEIFVFNLRGNARTQGESRRKEGGNVFGEGSRTGVTITFLVKTSENTEPAQIHYCDIGDYLTREEKLERLARDRDVTGTEYVAITPNKHGDWINQRDERFTTYQPIGDSDTALTRGIFDLYSRGLATSRDAWCYGFSRRAVEHNMERLVLNYNAFVDGDVTQDDPSKINWNRGLRADAKRGRLHEYRPEAIRISTYRPFTKQWAYFDRPLNDMVYQLHRLWPTNRTENLGIYQVGAGSAVRFSVFMTSLLPDLHVTGAGSGGQVFARWRWEPVDADDGGLNLDALDASEDDVVVDGHRRLDNITDETFDLYRATYANEPGGDELSKDDIFYYVYALLHHPEYRERYEADLKKLLPHIPCCRGFFEYVRIGRELADLHVNYEQVPVWEGLEYEYKVDTDLDPYRLYRIGMKRMSWTARNKRTGLKYNENLTITNIPAEADEYKIGGRSPLEWIVDRYYVKTDKASGIVNDPNDWLREQDNPSYVVDLIGSLVTVSMETQRLVGELPEFEVVS